MENLANVIAPMLRSFGHGRVLTGTMSGHIYVWDCRNAKTVKAMISPLMSVCVQAWDNHRWA